MVRKIIESIIPMSDASLRAITDLVEKVTYNKNEVFIKINQRNKSEYFVLEGICRSFLLSPEGTEITISFFSPNSILSPYTTRISSGLSTMNFEALTEVTLGIIDAAKFEDLMVNNLEIREFGNAVLRNELIAKINKETSMASLTAKDRLINFRQNYPLLENLIAHTHISSYLGITTISLSRLRRELMTR